MKTKCLYCYKEIDSEELNTLAGGKGYHQKCSKQFFGAIIPPELDFTQDQMLELAEQIVKSQKTVTGVQPKLSLGISRNTSTPERFTIVGLWGEYILKPQTVTYKSLPELEDVSMHLAKISKLKTVEHSLIRLKSGHLAYITKRIDRKNGRKFHMEDMCQITGRMTEHKYKGSYEQIAKAIQKHTENPGLNVVDFFELVLFSFLIGNNDMHLKNFSLLKRGISYDLCPAYDLIAAKLVMSEDDEDLALSLNGKKKKIKKKDFEIAMKGAGLRSKVIENIFNKYKRLIPRWIGFIDKSFLSYAMQEEYKSLIMQKATQVELV